MLELPKQLTNSFSTNSARSQHASPDQIKALRKVPKIGPSAEADVVTPLASEHDLDIMKRDSTQVLKQPAC